VISDATNKVTTTVTGLDGPYGIAFDSHLNQLFVANNGAGTVSVIPDSGGSANTVTATIMIGSGSEPTGVAFDSNLNEVYVTNNGAGTISVISG